jgi:hypothetical protein
MIHHKSYDLITLANHQPSKWARDMITEYRREGERFTEIRLWLVTNNLSLRQLKRKFKFDDLPCLIITEQIASNRKRKEYFYRDNIEQAVRALTMKEMRKHARINKGQSSDSLRLRLHKAEQAYKRDVIPAAEDVSPPTGDMPEVSKRKGKRSKKTTTNV